MSILEPDEPGSDVAPPSASGGTASWEGADTGSDEVMFVDPDLEDVTSDVLQGASFDPTHPVHSLAPDDKDAVASAVENVAHGDPELTGIASGLRQSSAQDRLEGEPGGAD